MNEEWDPNRVVMLVLGMFLFLGAMVLGWLLIFDSVAGAR